jgi:hypothetical protein
MQIEIRRPKIRTGELLVEVNGSGLRQGGEPYAEIQFTDDAGAAILVNNPADCDRLIRAAAEAKRKLMAAVVPHAFRDGEDKHWECRECGVHEGHHIDAPVITDSERDCDQVNPDGSGWYCYRSGPHTEHRDSNGDTWTTPERPVLEVVHAVPDESAAPVYLLACKCQRADGNTYGPGEPWNCIEHGLTTIVMAIPLAAAVAR